MKNFIILSLFLFGFLPNIVKASGSFELIDFPESYSGILEKEFKTNISFFYSGTESYPKVSIVGKKFPNGVSLGEVSLDGNSLYNVSYSGIPKSTGDYPLILTLTDDNGALLIKKFNFKVDGLTFAENYLPNAVVNEPYLYNLDFIYPYRDILPEIIFNEVPQGIILSPLMNFKAENGHFVLKLLAYKTGHFTLNAEVRIGGKLIGYGRFNLIVDDKKQVKVINLTPAIPTTIQTQTVPIVKSINKTPSTIKEVERGNKTDTQKFEPKESVILQPNSDSVKKLRWHQRFFNWLLGR